MDVSKDACLGTFANTIDNCERALLERMFYTKLSDGTFAPPLKPQLSVFSDMRKFIITVASKCVKLHPLSLDEVVESYRGPKKTRYASALEKYRLTGFSRKHASITMFIKSEKSNISKPPRAIQPRHPIYNLLLARYLKRAEHHIYDAINKAFGGGSHNPTIMKGYNVQQTGNFIANKWHRFSSPVAIGADATKFDMHVSSQMLALEHELYNMLYNEPELATLLRYQRKTVGYANVPDGSLRYTIDGCRCSGDLNTSLGNCVIMCCMMYTWAKRVGVDIEFINNGDDCVIIMESSELDRFREGAVDFFRQCGFRMVFESPVYHLPQIEFCQSHPIRTRDGVVMVRNMPTTLGKDLMTTVDMTSQTTRDQWLYSVGDCGMSMYGDIPVFRDFYDMFMKAGRKCNYRLHRDFQIAGRYYDSVGMSKKYSPSIMPETMFDVYLAWGITPIEQNALERHYRRCSLKELISPEPLLPFRDNQVLLPY